MPTDQSNLIHAEIGKISVESAELEMLLASLAGALINDYQKFTRIVTTELSFPAKISLVLSLYRARHGVDEDYSEICRLVGEADNLQQQRNLVMHSIWRSAGAPLVVTRIKQTAKRRSGYSTQLENWDLDKFKNVTRGFRKTSKALADLYDELVEKGKIYENPVNPPSDR